MRGQFRFCIVVPVCIAMAACAPARQSANQADPYQAEIKILQKQLLELQVTQNDTKLKLEESKAAIKELSGRLRSVEAKNATAPGRQADLRSRSTATVAEAATDSASQKKKTLRKTKKKITRRQG